MAVVGMNMMPFPHKKSSHRSPSSLSHTRVHLPPRQEQAATIRHFTGSLFPYTTAYCSLLRPPHHSLKYTRTSPFTEMV